MSYLREIADALADGLGAATWSIASTTVQRKNWANVDLEDLATPRIYVTPGSASMTRVGRQVTQSDYSVDIFIGQHVQTDAEVDAMIDLADELLLYIRAHDWSNSENWPEGVTSPVELQIELNPDDALSERNAWRAVVNVTYRVFQADELPEE